MDAIEFTGSPCATSTTSCTVYYKCRQCNRLFMSLTSERVHRLTVHAASSTVIGCGRCGIVYLTEQDAKTCFYSHRQKATI